jgi:hypothetical protein
MPHKFATAALVVSINVAAGVAAVLGYYAYGKLSYPDFFCGSFAALDGEIGWIVAPDASSCIGGRAPFSHDKPWFAAKVFSDANGFRSARPGTQTARGGVLFAGDSWTFGYGVSFEDSFPGQVQKLSNVPAVVAASPAYGSAQTLMLAQRWLGRLAPRAIVYLDLGLWERSACSGKSRPRVILKPCYWQAPHAKTAELTVPPPGTVRRFASWGVLPGGMLGAGENSWRYFLISRPVALALELTNRAGLLPGFGHDFRAVGVDPAAIRRGVLAHLARIAAQARVPVLLLDPHDDYDAEFAALAASQKVFLHRIGKDVWRTAVKEPMAKLPKSLTRVPHDGHFGLASNALIAALIRDRLRALDAL